MNLQYISDSNGKTTGIFIPIKDWEVLKKRLKGLKQEEDTEPTKQGILDGIKQAVKEVNLIKQGKLKATPLKDFLDEL
ncbi:MAG: hypothetical protein FVQ77_15255 [Cytophagales bacterium]|nr:hypothetical protein [Cytophagales bacterium]